MSERSRGREQSEQSGASERVSGASERANGRVSGPVLTSVFFSIFDQSKFMFLFSCILVCVLQMFDQKVWIEASRDLTKDPLEQNGTMRGP